MYMYYILYNPLSSNGKSVEILKTVETRLTNEGHSFSSLDIIEVSKNIETFLKQIKEEDKVVILGGDGTLHRFANAIRYINYKNEIFLYKGGTGNDFSREFKKQQLINITSYVRDLPRFKADDHQELVFLNGVGFGLDGAVCNAVNETVGKKKNAFEYVKKLLSTIKKFPRYDLELVVDGVRHTYKNVWLTTVNNGKYFGGGMKISPLSDRTDDILEVTVVHTVSFPKLLCIFPFIFIGKHLWFKKQGVSVLKGRKFTLTASSPQPLQGDGEVIENVREIVVEIDEKK